MQKKRVGQILLYIIMIVLLLINIVSAFSLKNWLTGFIAYDVETQKCEDEVTTCKKDCLTPYTSCLRTCDAQANSASDSCQTNCNSQSTSCGSTCRQTYNSCVAAARVGTTRMTSTDCETNLRTCSSNCATTKNTCTGSCNTQFNITSCKNQCTTTQESCNQENTKCDEQLTTCKQQVEQQYPPKDCLLENMKHNEFKCKTTRILQQCVDGTLNNIPCENGCNSIQNKCNAPIAERQLLPRKPSTKQLPSSLLPTLPSTTPQTTPSKTDIDKRLTYLLQKKNEGKISDQVLTKSLLGLFRLLDNETITKLITDLNNGVLTVDAFKEDIFKAEEEHTQKQQQAVEENQVLSADNVTNKTVVLGTITTQEEQLETSTRDEQAVKSFDEVFQDLVGNTLTEEQVNEEIKKLLPEATPDEIEAFKKQIKEGSLNKEDLHKKLEEIKKKEDVAGETADETAGCSVIVDYSTEDVCYQQVIADDEACCSGENGWDNFCENSYRACADPDSFKTKVCTATSPYSYGNECYIETIKEDVMCCDEEWDDFCDAEYDEFISKGVCEGPVTEGEKVFDQEDAGQSQYSGNEFTHNNDEENYDLDNYAYDHNNFNPPDLFGYDVDVSSQFDDNLEVNRIRSDFQFDVDAEGIGFEENSLSENAEEAIPEDETQVSEETTSVSEEELTPEQIKEKEDQEIQKKLANNKIVVLRNDEISGIRLGKNQHRELLVGTILSKGTRIETNTLGALVLATQEVRIRAEPESKLEVKRIKNSENTREINFGLEYGIIKLNKNKGSRVKASIETPNAIIDIDGAAEVAYDDGEKETMVRVAEGSAIVKSKVESDATEVYKHTETKVKGTPNLLLRIAYFIKG